MLQASEGKQPVHEEGNAPRVEGQMAVGFSLVGLLMFSGMFITILRVKICSFITFCARITELLQLRTLGVFLFILLGRMGIR